MKFEFLKILSIVCLVVLMGCSGNRGNIPQQSYAFPSMEAQWIRDGEPLEFEGVLWYPADDAETLLDTEIQPLAMYKGVQIFIDKLDVRPYNRLYTKFGINKFRYFQIRKDDDPR